MLKQNPLWSQSLAFCDLPNPEHPPTYSNDSLDLQTFNDRVLSREHPCVVQRELRNYRRKAAMGKQRMFCETMQEAALRAQIRLTRQQEDPPLFSSLRKQYRQKPQQSAIRIYPQQSRPKPTKPRLRPMISETHFEAEFLSVGKMALVQGERGKKSQSVLVCAVAEEKVVTRAERYLPCSQLIREINVIKEKFNIQRILTTHAHEEESPKNFHRFISIRAYDSRKCRKKEAYRQPTQDTEDSKLIVDVVPLAHPPKNELATILSVSSPAKSKQSSTPLEGKEARERKPRKVKPFSAPFEGYLYRDMLWKVNFTNGLCVEVPLEYEQRLRAHIGRGNNSCMVAGLITRRPWFTFTDRPEDANFLWTQLKVLPFLRKQEELPGSVPQSIDTAKGYQLSLLTIADSEKCSAYLSSHGSLEHHCDSRLLPRSKFFQFTRTIKSGQIRDQRMHNHLVNNYVIGNKKALFHTMAHYFRRLGEEPFRHLPLTFHLTNGTEDQQYYEFLRYYHKRNREIARMTAEGGVKQFNAWIVKPGENSNRGNGIKVCLTLEEVRAAVRVKESYGDGTYRTYIVQAYIERPLLYCKRKFDLRHYVLMTCVNGHVKGYWYRDGYVRTTSAEYSLAGREGRVHLTNDAVQKQLPEYGKFEKGNKLSYEDLSSYIDRTLPAYAGAFNSRIYPRMRQLATHALRACSGSIDPRKLANNFELFGLDFMIDGELDVWLIEVNSNPCLELSCPLLATLIPRLVENTLQLTLDALFPPPARSLPRGQIYTRDLEKENRFQMVFDERVEELRGGPEGLLDERMLEEEDDVFEDCGDDWDEG